MMIYYNNKKKKDFELILICIFIIVAIICTINSICTIMNGIFEWYHPFAPIWLAFLFKKLPKFLSHIKFKERKNGVIF